MVRVRFLGGTAYFTAPRRGGRGSLKRAPKAKKKTPAVTRERTLFINETVMKKNLDLRLGIVSILWSVERVWWAKGKA